MTEPRLVTVGRIGRAHGVDGGFYVDRPDPALPSVGEILIAAGRERRVERRGGTAERPLVRLEGIADRDAAAGLRGTALQVPETRAPLAEGEWLVEDLVGCRVEGMGEVRAVVSGPSCDVLEVGDPPQLVPLVRDAVRRVDPAAGLIEVDRRFLGLDREGGEAQ